MMRRLRWRGRWRCLRKRSEGFQTSDAREGLTLPFALIILYYLFRGVASSSYFSCEGGSPRTHCLGGGEPLRVAKPALPRPRTPDPFRARFAFGFKVNLNKNLGLIQPEVLLTLLCVESFLLVSKGIKKPRTLLTEVFIC